MGMTNREKTLDWLYRLRSEIYVYMPKEWLIPMSNALDLAIKALEQEPTTKNDLAVDKEQLKTMIRGLTKWYVKRDNTEVGEPNTAVGLLYDDVMFGIDRLPLVTSQEPRKGKWIDTNDKGFEYHRIYKCSNCEYTVCAYPEEIKRYKFCYGCGSRNEVEK